jgi:hypothetical protein
MTELTEQRVGYGFGLLGGVLIAIGGLVSLALGTADLLLGRPYGALSAASEAVVLFVLGGLAIFFAWLGRHDWSSRPLASGILLVVLAVLGWVVGVGANLLALVGSLFVVLAGVLYLLEPAKKAASAVVTSA